MPSNEALSSLPPAKKKKKIKEKKKPDNWTMFEKIKKWKGRNNIGGHAMNMESLYIYMYKLQWYI